jgi:hypothetical protein
MLRIEQNLPARSQKRGEASIPRVGKGLPGFGIERAPSREGVSALDHQSTPAAQTLSYFGCLYAHQAEARIGVCAIMVSLTFNGSGAAFSFL